MFLSWGSDHLSEACEQAAREELEKVCDPDWVAEQLTVRPATEVLRELLDNITRNL